MKRHPCLGCYAETGDILQAYCHDCIKEKTFPKASFWNHRVILSGAGKNQFASIREVHYSKHGRIEGWTAEPAKLIGNDFPDLIRYIENVQSSVMVLGLRSMQGLILRECELEQALAEVKK